MRKPLTLGLFVLLALTLDSSRAQALSGAVNFVVLRVTFADFPSGSRFSATQTQSNVDDIAKLWGAETSYGAIDLHYQIAGPYRVASTSSTYLDIQSGQSSSSAAMLQLLKDAVAASPNTIDWTKVYGVVVDFSDPRPNGFYRGITYPSATAISPPHAAPCGACNVHFSIVGESPSEDVARTWGRWAHETGHQMQQNPGNPWHPSNYNSDFEQMDGEYPAQSGVFNKESNTAYPGWLPTSKYKTTSPPNGAQIGLYAEERPPASEPDPQAIKAYLTFGGTKVYYLVSVRHHILGDDVATTHGPSGLPDQGVLIERVVEGGDPSFTASDGLPRWVFVENNGSTADTLWHPGDTYHSSADGIYIAVEKEQPDADHYDVVVRYADSSGQPDVGMQSWLQPPGNTWESTDIWIDSPANGYGTFRYGTWSDLLGGVVPQGNGDDPAVGQVNRFYARVRNYGSKPATNVVVHFDVTNPPGVGINGSNGFAEIGHVSSAQFSGLTSIAPGKTVDVFYNWKPDYTLTPAQIAAGTFFFHTCVRVRIDHVPGETFFANQDGDGQQENIDYFQATSAGTPGSPGAPNAGTIRIRNDSASTAKQFALSTLRSDLPPSWKLNLNNGNPIVDLGPGETRDIPVEIAQTQSEPVGTRHTFAVFASSQVTLHNDARPNDLHTDFKTLGGTQLQVAVLAKPKLTCTGNGRLGVTGTLTDVAGQGPERVPVEVVGVTANAGRVSFTSRVTYGYVGSKGGAFTATFADPALAVTPPKYAVCLYAGSTTTASAGSAIFSP